MNKGPNITSIPIPRIFSINGICGSMKSKTPFITPPNASKNPFKLSLIGSIILLNVSPTVLKNLPSGSIIGFNILPMPAPAFPPSAPPAAPNIIPMPGIPVASPNLAPNILPPAAPIPPPTTSSTSPPAAWIEKAVPNPAPTPSPILANLLRWNARKAFIPLPALNIPAIDLPNVPITHENARTVPIGFLRNAIVANNGAAAMTN